MESLAISFPAALLAGLAFGAGPCNVTCLPYLGPIFLGSGDGMRRGWRVVLPFSLGRLASYAGLGAVAGALGYGLTEVIAGYADPLLGAATVLAGLLLAVRRPRACNAAGPGAEVAVRVPVTGPGEATISLALAAPGAPGAATFPAPVSGCGGGVPAIPAGPGARGGEGAMERSGPHWWLTLFGMGAAMGLNPCLPLGTILTGAAASGSAGGGLLLGVGFGLGAVAVPALIFSTLVAHFGTELRANLGPWSARASLIGGVALIALGLATAGGVLAR